MTDVERRNLAQYIKLTIQREVAVALERRDAQLAEAIMAQLGAERRDVRRRVDNDRARIAALEVEQRTLLARIAQLEGRATPDNSGAPVLFDLSDERRRRSGQ